MNLGRPRVQQKTLLIVGLWIYIYIIHTTVSFLPYSVIHGACTSRCETSKRSTSSTEDKQQQPPTRIYEKAVSSYCHTLPIWCERSVSWGPTEGKKTAFYVYSNNCILSVVVLRGRYYYALRAIVRDNPTLQNVFEQYIPGIQWDVVQKRATYITRRLVHGVPFCLVLGLFPVVFFLSP